LVFFLEAPFLTAVRSGELRGAKWEECCNYSLDQIFSSEVITARSLHSLRLCIGFLILI
jgi:hypothetical protein